MSSFCPSLWRSAQNEYGVDPSKPSAATCAELRADGRLPETRALQDERPIVVVGHLVIAGSDTGFLAAYDALTCVQRWKIQSHRGTVLALRTDANRAFSPDFAGALSAVEADTGKFLWLRGVGSNGSYDDCDPSPLVIGDILYVLRERGLIAMLVR